jgi:hypothetical protein
LETFLQESPNSPTSIQCKVTVVISCYGLLRISELVKLTFEQFKMEESCCFISVQRRKSSGNLRSSTFAINDPVCMDILKFQDSILESNVESRKRLRGDHYASNSSVTVDMSTAQNCTFNYFGPNHCVEYKKKEETNENSNEL